MYVVVVYDCEEDRTDKPRKLLRQYLTHIQNSVFEGSVTEGQLKEIRKSLEDHHKEGESIVIYKTTEHRIDRKVMGKDPKEDEKFI
jgi:CRISPR-associated protein Cas2